MLMVAATQCQVHRPATARRVCGACHLLWQLDDELPLLLPRAALEGVITFSLTAVPQVQLQQQLMLLLCCVASDAVSHDKLPGNFRAATKA